MDHKDRQHLWRDLRAQCALIGRYATLHEEEIRTAEGVRGVVVALLETVEALLTGDQALDEAEQAEDRASEICDALITSVFDLRRRQS